MKKRLYFLLAPLLFWNCVENSTNTKSNVSEKKSPKTQIDTTFLQKKDTILLKETIPTSLITNAPCEALQGFVHTIESMGWVSDPERLQKVPIYEFLNREKRSYFNERPFYAISFENSNLYNACTKRAFRVDSSEIPLFEGVDNIWGYFYREKGATNWISDGVIEQWEFPSEAHADKALSRIMDIGFKVYFNTNPYFCRINNKLIIFQSRAMAFSFDQRPLFEKFDKDYTPITKYP